MITLEVDNLTQQNHSALPQLHRVQQESSVMILISTLSEKSSSLGRTGKIVFAFLFIPLLAGLLWLCFQDEDTSSTASSASKSPRNNLSEDEALKLSVSAWPRAYLLANEEEKKALELLLLCRIIPPDEFANGDVSEEHVEECMWIAMQMLRQKDYIFWTRNPLQAARAFDNSVTSRFPERTCVRSAVSTSGAITPEFAAPYVASYAQSACGVVDCRSKPMTPSEPVSPAVPQFYVRDSGTTQIKEVQVRCEELATGSAKDLTPRCMIRALQGMPPPLYGRFNWPEGASIPPSQDTVITLGSRNPA